MIFLDTNVLAYIPDSRDPEKRRIAMSIIAAACDSPDFLVSAQVLNEFANVAMRKLGKTRDETLEFLGYFERIRTVPVLPGWTARAIEIMGRYGIQFFDALLVAAAEAHGCDTIYTEDLADGQTYCGVRAENPFRTV